jgi:hypothetical protein
MPFGWRPLPPLRSNQYEESQSTTSVSPSAAAAAVGSNQLNFGLSHSTRLESCILLRAMLCVYLRPIEGRLPVLLAAAQTAETRPSSIAQTRPRT